MEKQTLEQVFQQELCFDEVPITINRKKKGFLGLPKEEQDTIQIPYIFTGTQGIYVFLEDIQDAKQVFIELGRRLGKKEPVYIFSGKEETGFCWIERTGEVVELSGFLSFLEAFVQYQSIPEHLKDRKLNSIDAFIEKITENDQFVEEIMQRLPENEEMYVRSAISTERLEQIDDILQAMIEEEPCHKGKFIYYPDGTVKRKGYISSSYGGYECSYPCDERDPDTFFWTMVAGGIFGMHHFANRKFGKGVLYLLTCGVCGLYYVSDVLAMITGNYFYTDVDYFMGEDKKVGKKSQKIYMKPIQKKWVGVIGLVASIAISLIMLNVYGTVFENVIMLLSEMAQNSNVNYEQVIGLLS